MVKKGVKLVSVIFVGLLVLSVSFASASVLGDFFGNFWNKITGKAISNPYTFHPRDGTIINNSERCSDSDNGIFFYVNGTVSYDFMFNKFGDKTYLLNYADRCYRGNLLIEYYCRFGVPVPTLTLCDKGCKNGACVKTCVDKDSEDVYTKGTASNQVANVTDSCGVASQQILCKPEGDCPVLYSVKEAVCGADGNIETKEVYCNVGEVCGDGVCAAAPLSNATRECTDSDGGKIYDVLGSTFGYQRGFLGILTFKNITDYCADASTLSEGYCSGSLMLAEQHTCAEGCADGVCVVVPKENGAECASNDECISGTCIRGMTGAGVCNETYTGEACVEEDNRSYYIQGDVFGLTYTRDKLIYFDGQDVCMKDVYNDENASNANLFEFSCSNEQLSSETYACPNGCENGACIAPPVEENVTCTESDNGENYNLFGIAQNVSDSKADFCFFDEISGFDKVGEYHCAGSDIAYSDSVCENGCVDGACASANVTECVCTDTYEPVCGSGGHTYPNSCLATCAGENYTAGGCVSTSCDNTIIFDTLSEDYEFFVVSDGDTTYELKARVYNDGGVNKTDILERANGVWEDKFVGKRAGDLAYFGNVELVILNVDNSALYDENGTFVAQIKRVAFGADRAGIFNYPGACPKVSYCENGACVLYEGQDVNSNGYIISINFISADEVALKFGGTIGEVTGNLAEGGTFTLSDGSYVLINNINATGIAGEAGSVEFNFTAVTPATCNDSDDGHNYYLAGNITGQMVSGPNYDFCADNATLREVFCQDSLGYPETYDCPSGCENGACIPEGNACTDSDSGRNYFLSGTVSGAERGWWAVITGQDATPFGVSDECQINDTLYERYCAGTRRVTEAFDCPGTCKEGACINNSIQCAVKSNDWHSEPCNESACPEGSHFRRCQNREAVSGTEYKELCVKDCGVLDKEGEYCTLKIGSALKPKLKFFCDGFTFDEIKMNMLGELQLNEQVSGESKGYSVIGGINLTENGTKTIYVDKVSANSNAVCIKDEEIEGVGNISASCNQANETLIGCLGESGNYNCTVESGMFVISGLKHSGIIEYTISAPGGGTSGGGGGAEEVTIPKSSGGGSCITNWTCGGWGACAGGFQTRNCTKLISYCYANPALKPAERISCVTPVSSISTAGAPAEEQEKGISTGVIAITIVLAVLLIAGIVALIYMARKRKAEAAQK